MSVSFSFVDPHRAPEKVNFFGEETLVAHRIFAEWDMSNANGRAVLAELGLEMNSEYIWEGTSGGLLEACQRWLQGPGPIIGDEDKETLEQGLWVECGWRTGYLKDKVTLLRDECLKAIGLGGLGIEVGVY